MPQSKVHIAPGPRVYPVVGSLPTFWGRDRVFGNMEDIAAYGEVVRYRMGRGVTHFIRHPEQIRHVLQDNHTNYERGGRTGRIMRFFLGDGLITTEGAVWKRQRRLTQPAFHPHRLHAVAAITTEATTSALDDWSNRARARTPLELTDEMLRLTLRVVGRALFGADLSANAADIGHALTVAQQETGRRLRSVFTLPARVPTPHNRRVRLAIETLDRIVYGLIEARRRRGAEGDDLLGMLMAARDTNGSGFSDRELRDQVLTLITAGHETTAYALAWAFTLISEDPLVYRKLSDEVDQELGSRVPVYQDLSKLVYTRRVIDETLRLYPTVWVFARRALADDVVGGFHISKDSVIAISPFYTHRHPAFWKNPEGFDPDRFATEEAAARHKHAYLPFGGGPHLCIGAGLALMQMVLVVAMVTQRFRLDRVPGAPLSPEPLVSLRPRGGVQVLAQLRQGPAPSTA